jgi:hypothetical protein
VLTPTPTLLAFIGTGLTAIAVFAPGRPRPATVSFAPPGEPPAFERWTPPPASDDPEPPRPSSPVWLALVDPSADGSDVTVRLALVEALAALATPWADAILRHVLDEEPEPQVRAAAAAAMREAGYAGGRA